MNEWTNEWISTSREKDQKWKMRVIDSLKNYIFFFHSGTIGKHNIIYKLTYTIVIINNLQKPSWAFMYIYIYKYIYIYFFLFLFLFSSFFIGSLLVRRCTKKKKKNTWTECHGTRREFIVRGLMPCVNNVRRPSFHLSPLSKPRWYTGEGENDAEGEGEEECSKRNFLQ